MFSLLSSTGIESLFNKINCDRSAIDDMLGAATGVTDSNMIQYLGIIEQRTNELLAIQTYVTTKVSFFFQEYFVCYDSLLFLENFLLSLFG